MQLQGSSRAPEGDQTPSGARAVRRSCDVVSATSVEDPRQMPRSCLFFASNSSSVMTPWAFS
jgi:hypothetical protein